MRILFLNQYFPPDPAPTGVLLREIADALTADGHAVDFVSAPHSYRKMQRAGSRMRREIFSLASILVHALRRPRPDVVFSASSPPCLLVIATLAAWWHRARSIHWAMDVYPEIAVALGEIRASRLGAILSRVMAWCYRRAHMVVALDADMADCLAKHGCRPRIIRPWVFVPLNVTLTPPPTAVAPWTWIYSGNLGRAHEWETLLAAQAELERRDPEIRLLFQGGGPSWPPAQERARELKLQRCDWRDYAPETELTKALLAAGCCVVTERPEVRGLLWPSKLALLLALPRPILFVGPTDGAIAAELRPLAHARSFLPGTPGALADWLLELKAAPLHPERLTVIDAAEHRAKSVRQWAAWIQEIRSQPKVDR